MGGGLVEVENVGGRRIRGIFSIYGAKVVFATEDRVFFWEWLFLERGRYNNNSSYELLSINEVVGVV